MTLFYEDEGFMILPSKMISGSYPKQYKSDLVFQTCTVVLK